MKLAQEAISKAISIIAGVIANTPIYPTSKPSTKDDDEYIVVNTLPLPNDVLQVGVMNVNYHKKDRKGYPDLKSINAGVKKIIDAFEAYSPSEPNYIDFELLTEQILPEVDSKEHYSNLRYRIVLLN